jgi:hypothetical protein
MSDKASIRKELGTHLSDLLFDADLDTWAALEEASVETLEGIDGVGPASVENIRRAIARRPRRREPEIFLPQLNRRFVRYILFRIKRDAVNTMDRDLRKHADAIRDYFQNELQRHGYTWSGFTFTWDVAANDPYHIIPKDLRVWVANGGSYLGRPPGMSREDWAQHVMRSMLKNFQSPPLPLEPPAFTSQK